MSSVDPTLPLFEAACLSVWCIARPSDPSEKDWIWTRARWLSTLIGL